MIFVWICILLSCSSRGEIRTLCVVFSQTHRWCCCRKNSSNSIKFNTSGCNPIQTPTIHDYCWTFQKLSQNSMNDAFLIDRPGMSESQHVPICITYLKPISLLQYISMLFTCKDRAGRWFDYLVKQVEWPDDDMEFLIACQLITFLLCFNWSPSYHVLISHLLVML